MSAENLFGTSAEQADVASSVRKAPGAFAVDHITPTIIFSIIFCPATIALSYQYCTV